MPQGTKLLLPGAGTVKELSNPGGFGNYDLVTLDANPNASFILGHLSRYDVPSGHYGAGTVIADSGSTGFSTGPHLHFQENIGGKDVNPMDALTKGLGGGTLPDQIGSAINAPFDAVSQAVNNVAKSLDPQQIPARVLSGVASAFGSNNFVDFTQRTGLIALGLVVVIIGLVAMFKDEAKQAVQVVAPVAAAAA